MSELLFEIGVEELPAHEVDIAASFMKDFFKTGLEQLRLRCSSIKSEGTPRRLVLMIRDLSSKQEDVEETITGPSICIAYDEAGQLSRAGLGFLKAKGIDESMLTRISTDKGEVIAARKKEVGRSAKEVLPPLLLDMMRKIPFKKRMRWDSSHESFSRPVRWLLSILDGEHLPVGFADVSSSDRSSGHRFMSPQTFSVSSIDQYLDELKKRFVMLSADEREAMFVAGAKERLNEIEASFGDDRELLKIVRNLFEYPFVVFGTFEKKYLDIPKEILISEMRTHQKCFAVFDKNESLLPNFICSSGTRPYDENVFAKGNERVLKARFEDGAFYFKEDKNKGLLELAKGLSNLVFERELGTMADKSIRIETIALGLARLFELGGVDVDYIKRAAPLLKADLMSGVVGQFPELQGIMGSIYADIDGESKDVSEMIKTHYWPRFADDALPRLKSAALLSIADKIDTLVGIIAIGKKPTGNKDPFALRRSAIGIIRMLVHFGLSIDLDVLIEEVLVNGYGDRFRSSSKEIIKEVKDFLLSRARTILVDDLAKENKDNAVSIADSVMACGASDVLDIFARAQTLQKVREENVEEFDSITQAFKRAGNIVKKAHESEQIKPLGDEDEALLSSPQEQGLLLAIKKTKGLMADRSLNNKLDLLSLGDFYSKVFQNVALLKPKLDEFFDHVMVMADDGNTRRARLALLHEIGKISHRIADFTHL